MKRIYKLYVQPVLLVVGGCLLFAKILNWFLDFPEATVQMLNIGVHILLGLIFIGNAFFRKNLWVKAAYLVAGLVLLVIDILPPAFVPGYLILVVILLPIALNHYLEKPDYAESRPSD